MNEENKRILICLNSLEIGGVETACFTQIKEYARRNYEVYVLAGKGIYVEKIEKLSNVHFIEFDYEHKNGIEIAKIDFVVDILKKYKIDLVYIHKLECILSVFPACILSKIPYIAYLHMGILNTYEWYLGNLNITKAFLKAYFQNAYKIIGIAEQTIEENRELFDIEEGKYKLIPNSIDFKEFCNNNLQDNDSNKLLLITRLDKDKGNGIKNAIEFFKEYKNYKTDVTMDIIGDGAEKEKVEKEIQNQGLNIKLLGPKNNVSEFIRDYGIILGVGRCIQEAIAMKKLGMIVGYNDFNGPVVYENIIDVAKTNFSGRGLNKKDYKQTVKWLIDLTSDQLKEIIDKNYNWLYENRNIENNIYEVKNMTKAKEHVAKLNYSNLLRILFEEIGNMQRKYNKDVKNAWDIKESTEEFYLNREKWDKNQLQEKDKQISELTKSIVELEKSKKDKSSKFFEKIKYIIKKQ
ncbi:MAG: glycosyltransferase [Clostridium sp.]|nr:glycosyltransferase [Clostridium sp.]